MHIFSCVQEFVKAHWLFNTNFFGEVHSSMETSLKKVKLLNDLMNVFILMIKSIRSSLLLNYCNKKKKKKHYYTAKK